MGSAPANRIDVTGLTATIGRSELHLEIDGTPATIWTESSVPIDQTATPWLPALASIGLRGGRTVRGDTAVDPAALAGAERAVRTLAGWFGDTVRPTRLEFPVAEPRVSDDRGAGCFFSGGVDSFYSVLAHQQRLSHLILVHGLDISLDNRVGWAETVERASAAAADMGVPIVQVRTNLREVMRRFGPDWRLHGHGPFLAHVALLLAPVAHHVVVPASFSEQQLHPYSTHPDLDPLWSSSAVTITHHGVVPRADKVRDIARSEIAMRHLRVCWWNLSTSYNCGRCEKCLRTMVALECAGSLGACTTLPDRIPLAALRFLKIDQAGDDGDLFADENLAALRAAGKDDSDVARALRFAMSRGAVGDRMADTWFWTRVVRDAAGHLARSASDRMRARRPAPVAPPTVGAGVTAPDRAESSDDDVVR